jgi:hypothetical protein
MWYDDNPRYAIQELYVNECSAPYGSATTSDQQEHCLGDRDVAILGNVNEGTSHSLAPDLLEVGVPPAAGWRRMRSTSRSRSRAPRPTRAGVLPAPA